MNGMVDKEKFENHRFFKLVDPFDRFFIMEIKDNFDDELFNDMFEFLCIELDELGF